MWFYVLSFARLLKDKGSQVVVVQGIQLRVDQQLIVHYHIPDFGQFAHSFGNRKEGIRPGGSTSSINLACIVHLDS